MGIKQVMVYFDTAHFRKFKVGETNRLGHLVSRIDVTNTNGGVRVEVFDDSNELIKTVYAQNVEIWNKL